MMKGAAAVAAGLRYPSDGHRKELVEAVTGMDDAPARRHMTKFVRAVDKLSDSAWEELHTETLDLSPRFVPYVGHAVWGESYQRGIFMAEMVDSHAELDLDLFGELPDHLEPILRYLEATDAPRTDLIEVLPTAVTKMRKELGSADSSNPYLHVLDAAKAIVDQLEIEGDEE